MAESRVVKIVYTGTELGIDHALDHAIESVLKITDRVLTSEGYDYCTNERELIFERGRK